LEGTEKSPALLKSAFGEYYFKYGKLVDIHEHLEQREFEYMPFGSGMIRHFILLDYQFVLPCL
jgi:DNA primase catalytic subunit